MRYIYTSGGMVTFVRHYVNIKEWFYSKFGVPDHKHVTCRNNVYPGTQTLRFSVPDKFVFWTTPYNDYMPPIYTASHIGGQPWADPNIGAPFFQPRWNFQNCDVNRLSHMGKYQIDPSGYPLNPIGRTGLRGRGLLGRWGPNHAADPIVTRWKRDENDAIIKHNVSEKNILQMITIQRHDNRMWAIPGGMVDPGEKISTTLKREFIEEALNSSGNQATIEEFFATGSEVYKGYVDDQRNTDNAWIETVAYNFHDELGTKIGALQLSAGDDAMNVKWCDIDGNMLLHANHVTIVEHVAKRLKAHW